jgi:glycosyltransferase involved in cell wall biosynthesis
MSITLSQKNPAISVLMPFWNAENFLDASIASILNQTFRDFELILINDCSTDNSDAVVAKYLTDERIVYVQNTERKKLSRNYNHGLSIAKSDIVARMDGDDIAEPTRFEKQYAFLINNPDIVAVGSFVKIIDENGAVTGTREKLVDPEKIKREFIIQSSLVHPSVMYRKGIILKIGGYRHLEKGEDIDLWYRLVYSGYKVSNIPEYLLRYRIHSNSHTVSSGGNRKSALRQLALRRETIRKFHLSLRFKDIIFIVTFFTMGMILSDTSQKKLEGLYKKYFFHAK